MGAPGRPALATAMHPDPDFPHLNKKKIVVLVVVGLLVLLLAALLAVEAGPILG